MSMFNVIVLATAAASGASADILPIKVVVQLQEAPRSAPSPFADVGRFAVRRNEMEFKAVSCPDASNDSGELTCRLSCGADDADMRLQLFSPLKDRARQVAGLSPPGAFAVDVVSCRVTSRLPVVVVYQTPLVVAAELLASQPAVFNATASLGPAGLRFKPFGASAPQLLALAIDLGHRAAIAQLADLAALEREAQEVGRGAPAAVPADAAPHIVDARGRAPALGPVGAEAARHVRAARRARHAWPIRPVVRHIRHLPRLGHLRRLGRRASHAGAGRPPHHDRPLSWQRRERHRLPSNHPGRQVQRDASPSPREGGRGCR